MGTDEVGEVNDDARFDLNCYYIPWKAWMLRVLQEMVKQQDEAS